MIGRPPLKRTYTVPEAAAVLGVTPRTIHRLLRAGLLRSRPGVGGRRVLAADLWSLLRWGRPRAAARARTREEMPAAAA